MSFNLYKGLKKPLIFLGFKDKYIYYALGVALLGIGCLATLPNLLGGLAGFSISLLIGGGGIYLIQTMQKKKGLYNKTKNNNERHIFPNKIKLKKIKR